MNVSFYRSIVCLLIISLLCGMGSIVSLSYAQQVPGAIKYQAVLRDVNGTPLSGKGDVNIRITLRADNADNGQIAYSEEHLGVQTNAYGVVHLEIGRGHVLAGTTLNDVDWASHSYFVQIEVEMDGTGYTNMGNSELLTVPYAFMAGNVKGQSLYDNLSDGYLPRYSQVGGTLVNSVVSQSNRDLSVDASSVSFLNTASGKPGYRFPDTAGRKGQVLVLTDNMGNLTWGNVEGGGSGTGGGWTPGFTATDDGRLLYWNDPVGEVSASPLVFHHADDRRFELETSLVVNDSLVVEGDSYLRDALSVSGQASLQGDVEITGSSLKVDIPAGNIEINGQVSGNNNLMTNNLASSHFWLGNASGQATPCTMSGHLSMDNTGKTSLNVAYDGKLQLKPGTAGAVDTLSVPFSASDSIWMLNASNHIYTYNRGLGQTDVRVGIGLEDPMERLHVEGGNVLFTHLDAGTALGGNNPRFWWNASKAAFRVGALSGIGQAWNDAYVGNYSVAMGKDATASGEHSFALGYEAVAQAPYSIAWGRSAKVNGTGSDNALVIGNESQASASNTLAIGFKALSSAQNTLAIGSNVTASGENAIVIGQGTEAEKDAIVLGTSATGKKTVERQSILIGRNMSMGANSIGIGRDVAMGSGSIVMGVGVTVSDNQIVIGDNVASSPAYMGGVIVGQGYTPSGLSFGRMNTDNSSAGNAIMIGEFLDVDPSHDNVMMLGSNFFSTDNLSQNQGQKPFFMVGSPTVNSIAGTPVAFEIDQSGNAYILGELYTGGLVSEGGLYVSSDLRLKSGVRQLSCTRTAYNSIRPVKFSYTKDVSHKERFGFLAQDVQQVFPQLVREDAKGMLSVDYIGFIPLLWQTQSQLLEQVDRLKEENIQLKDRQVQLEQTLSDLKARQEALENQLLKELDSLKKELESLKK